jgi:hypothetical protein
MIKPMIKQLISPLAVIALLLGTGKQASAALVNPQYCATPQGCWAYSLKDNIGQGSSAQYYPTSISELAGSVFQGYVTYDPVIQLTPPDTVGFWVVNDTDDLYLFTTYLTSSIDQTITLLENGDDGHSLFINDIFVEGGGFATGVTYNLSLQAGIPVKLTATLYQGPFAGAPYPINPPGGTYDGVLQFGVLVGVDWIKIQEVPGIQISAEITAQPVPESSSTLGLLALATLGAASTLKRKLKPYKSTEKDTTKNS